jgi:hypothetical protein
MQVQEVASLEANRGPLYGAAHLKHQQLATIGNPKYVPFCFQLDPCISSTHGYRHMHSTTQMPQFHARWYMRNLTSVNILPGHKSSSARELSTGEGMFCISETLTSQAAADPTPSLNSDQSHVLT